MMQHAASMMVMTDAVSDLVVEVKDGLGVAVCLPVLFYLILILVGLPRICRRK